MYNWLEINKGDFGYLYVKPRKVTQDVTLKVLWSKIYDQYIAEIGLTPDYIALLEAMKRCTMAMCDNALEPTSLNATKEAQAKQAIEQLSSGKAGKFSEFVAMVEKYVGFPVDLKQITVEKFYAYVKIMQREAEAVRNG